MMKLFLRILLLLLGIAVIGGGYVFIINFKTDNQRSDRVGRLQEKVWNIRTLPAKFSTHNVTREIYGEVVAQRVSDLSFRISGCIATTTSGLRAGKSVRQGQKLAQMDTDLTRLALREERLRLDILRTEQQELANRAANLKAIRAHQQEIFDAIETSLKRQKKLLAGGFTTESSLERIEREFHEAQSALRKSDNEIFASQSALKNMVQRIASGENAIAKARLQIKYATLTAPHDGIITLFDVEQGECITAHKSVVRIIDNHSHEIILNVPVHIFQKVEKNDAIMTRKISTTLENGTNLVLKVIRVLPQLKDNSQMVQIVTVPHDGEKNTPHTFLAGQDIRAQLVIEKLDHVIALPLSALFDGNKIFIVTADNRLEMKTINALARSGDQVYITGDITENAPIMTTRLPEAITGLKVRILVE